MADNKAHGAGGSLPAKFLGSLREALAAAGREDPSRPPVKIEPAPIALSAPAIDNSAPRMQREAVPLTAAATGLPQVSSLRNSSFSVAASPTSIAVL